ncbi:MAG: hypothetical protein ACQERD_00360 [Campylobacterota bacterium]
MEKNSFSIFETILSLTILSIITTGFLKVTFDTKSDEKFQDLNSLENSFTTSSYKTFDSKNKNLNLTFNDSTVETVKVKKYEYNSSKIKLYKYEYEK